MGAKAPTFTRSLWSRRFSILELKLTAALYHFDDCELKLFDRLRLKPNSGAKAPSLLYHFDHCELKPFDHLGLKPNSPVSISDAKAQTLALCFPIFGGGANTSSNWAQRQGKALQTSLNSPGNLGKFSWNLGKLSAFPKFPKTSLNSMKTTCFNVF